MFSKIEIWDTNNSIMKKNPSKMRTLITNINCEVIDIINEKKYKESWTIETEYTVDKNEAHEKWLLHKAVFIWVYNSKWEILLQKRSLTDSSYPGCWDISAAWHIKSWENMLDGWLRELSEELWSEFKKEKYKESLRFLFQYQENSIEKKRIENEIINVYALKFDWSIKDLEPNKEEVESIRFISLKNFQKWIEQDKKTLKLWFKPKFVPKFDWFYNSIIQMIENILAKNN